MIYNILRIHMNETSFGSNTAQSNTPSPPLQYPLISIIQVILYCTTSTEALNPPLFLLFSPGAVSTGLFIRGTPKQFY